MLNVMRENLKHLKWVLWIVAVSMVLYLGVYFGRSSSRGGANADWAAKVDGESISVRTFLAAAQRTDQYYRKLLGPQYEQLKTQLNLGRQTIQSLVDRQIMLSEARQLGLGASNDEISHHIVSDPQFRDAGGQFVGKQRYVEVMSRYYPGGASAFEQNVGEEITLDKWKNLVSQPITVSDEELKELYRTQNDKAEIDYAVVATASQKFDTTVTDSEVQAWYDAHKENYGRGEGRKIRYVVIDRQSQLAKVKVTDDEIKAYYDSHLSQFSHPEQRRASHILFRVDPNATPEARAQEKKKAEETLEKIRKGEDFATLARTLSQDPGSAAKGGDLGFFARGSMVPAFDKAAFETPVGQVAPLVETEYGYHILKVTDSRPAGAVPIDEVREAIRRQLELTRAQELAQADAQRIRATIPSAKDLEAAAAREHLKVEEAFLTRADHPQDLSATPEMLDAVFALPVDGVSQPVPARMGVAIIASLAAVPAGIRPIAEVKDQVRTEIINARAREAALANARRAIGAQPDLASAAKALGIEVKKSGPISPGQAIPGVGRAPDLDAAIFAPGAAVGARGAVPFPAGAILYAVTSKQSFDPTKFEQQKQQLRAETLDRKRAELLQSVLNGVRRNHKVEINEEMVDRIRG